MIDQVIEGPARASPERSDGCVGQSHPAWRRWRWYPLCWPCPEKSWPPRHQQRPFRNQQLSLRWTIPHPTVQLIPATPPARRGTRTHRVTTMVDRLTSSARRSHRSTCRHRLDADLAYNEQEPNDLARQLLDTATLFGIRFVTLCSAQPAFRPVSATTSARRHGQDPDVQAPAGLLVGPEATVTVMVLAPAGMFDGVFDIEIACLT
jgi:hypothetical protein